MATNSVKVTLQIRHDTAENWLSRNPVLAQGEYGLEDVNFLLKVGDGVRDWAHLPYINKYDASYFKKNDDGTITFSDEFQQTIDTLEAAAGQAITHITITDPPVNNTDATNKQYVDEAIRNAGHLKRSVVAALPDAATADPNTLYMVLAQDGTHYDEYMAINGLWDLVGATGDGGSGGTSPTYGVATDQVLGLVRASYDPESDYLNVTEQGFMTLNKVSTSKLYVPTGDTLIIHGGTA